MSVSTKTGDKGKTSLWSLQKVWKDDQRVEAYGTTDELNSFLGLAKHYLSDNKMVIIIETIQQEMFKVGGELATQGKEFKDPISEKNVDWLTNKIIFFESNLKLKGFVLPGKNIASAHLDVCRTVVRRCERLIVPLVRNKEVSEILLKYMNRLSDLIYVMARCLEI